MTPSEGLSAKIIWISWKHIPPEEEIMDFEGIQDDSPDADSSSAAAKPLPSVDGFRTEGFLLLRSLLLYEGRDGSLHIQNAWITSSLQPRKLHFQSHHRLSRASHQHLGSSHLTSITKPKILNPD